MPWLLYDGAAEVDEHPLLALLARPNRGQAGADFREALAGYLLTAGNAYVEAVSVDGIVRELHTLRPDRMKVVPGSDGWPEAYDYSVGGRSVRFAVPADGHVADPASETLPSARRPLRLRADRGGGGGARHPQCRRRLEQGAARQFGAALRRAGLSAKDGGNLTTEQYERLKAELEAGFTGARRAGRPLLLEGGLDWKAMSLSPKDMDFLEAKNGAAREIALAFGVPPMLLGIPGDNTYANFKEANAAFWRCDRAAADRQDRRGARRLAGAVLRRGTAGGDRRARTGYVCGSMPTRWRRCPPTARRCGSASPRPIFSPSTRSARRSAISRSRKARAPTR